MVIDIPDLDGPRSDSEGPLPRQAAGRRRQPAKDRARARPASTGADLANAVNEAALLAARRKAKQMTQKDLEEAVEKVVAGPERKSRRLDAEGKRRVAYHESGHALVAAYSEHADPVQKISIVPRGRAALGYTLQMPADDKFLLTRAELSTGSKGCWAAARRRKWSSAK